MSTRLVSRRKGFVPDNGKTPKDGAKDDGKGWKRRWWPSLSPLLTVVVIVLFFLLFASSMNTIQFTHPTQPAPGDSSIRPTSRTIQRRDHERTIHAPTTASCSLAQFSIDDAPLQAGSKQPVMVRGWDAPEDWTEPEFRQKFGGTIQYIKDDVVQTYKQKTKKKDESHCRLSGSVLMDLTKSDQTTKDILFFTNDQENKDFMDQLAQDYPVPEFLHFPSKRQPFQVFSSMRRSQSHSFHRHGESWLGLVTGAKQWWFLPPDAPKPDRVQACDYATGAAALPEGAVSCIQQPGDIIWFPKGWYHATCALDDWTVGIGAQHGPLSYVQQYPKVDQTEMDEEQIQTMIQECLGIERLTNRKLDDNIVATATALTSQKAQQQPTAKLDFNMDADWKFFDGDINAYYNNLEKDIKRNPKDVLNYAVHRWMGEKKSTEEHYYLIHSAVFRYHAHTSDSNFRVFDGGCGLGSGLMWLEQKQPNWDLTGHTLSEDQLKFIDTKLPKHHFKAYLKSFDDPEGSYDFIYSIEALIHSTDVVKTMRAWSAHLNTGGIIAIIDDYLAVGVDKDDAEVVAFQKSWLANTLITPLEAGSLARKLGLNVLEVRDLGQEYRVNELNYQNKVPEIKLDKGRSHQGWLGAKLRTRLMMLGKITYNMVVLQKPGSSAAGRSVANDANCETVPTIGWNGRAAQFTAITPELMSGVGKDGGEKMRCISGWYCCNKGQEWYDTLEKKRTERTQYLHLDRDLFGHYIDSFAKYLNEHFETYPEGTTGRFLDIGGTGSTASGMQQVTSKFQHFAGPLEYWKLDSDPAAEKLDRTLCCDIDDCPDAPDCGFDVTFSHTVLEHARRPWKSFDTIARITKKGGLTMHLVPWSYQFHATPEDNYRFSHTALRSLLEDRGFTVLDVGYDVCWKPNNVRNRHDEHYDTIWLTYVVGRKN